MAGPINPANNKLPEGVNEEQVREAVAKSGYPLQTIIAADLRKNFYVQEEWSYIDGESKELRTTDILATMRLYEQGGQRIRPTLNLVIECKQSELPYVFFLSGSKFHGHEFPVIAGLFHDKIELTTDDSRSTTWSLPILMTLDLHRHQFITDMPAFCVTFSKCVRKGKELELSGSDAFNGLVLPLIKALHHFKKTKSPPKTVMYFDCHLVVGLAILDSPMIGVRIANGGQEFILSPWVRVLRHESYENEDWTARSRLFAIDILHKDFFQEYLQNNLLPFAQDFSVRALRHQEEIAKGKGFASGLEKDSWNEIEKRLRPR